MQVQESPKSNLDFSSLRDQQGKFHEREAPPEA